MQNIYNKIILLRGGGDIATGVALRLYRSGFRRIIIFEKSSPLAVRRTVSFSEAVFTKTHMVEGVCAQYIKDIVERFDLWAGGYIPVYVDPSATYLHLVQPDIEIEATLAKCNIGVCKLDAPLVIGLGPGFTAGHDVHCVVETNRGQCLGRALYHGHAEPNTSIPGNVLGYTKERVLRSPCDGVFTTDMDIGDKVAQGMPLGYVAGDPVVSGIKGYIRGLLRNGTSVTRGLKLGDIEPRDGIEYHLVSEKALAIAGGVLEAIMTHYATLSASEHE